MQNAFVQVRGDQIIIDRSDFMMYAAIAVAVIVILIIVTIAMKRRKTNFIKTVPTNLKEEE